MILSNIHSGLPLKYESFLTKKYNSYITTCRNIQVYYPNHEIYYILLHNNDELTDLIVFGIKGYSANCFNSLVSLDQNIIIDFTQKVFKEFPKLVRIKIDASYQEYNLNKSIMTHKSDNQILKLPANIEDYLSELGQKKRKNIRNRFRKLSTDFKSVVFTVKYGNEIDEELIQKIIQFNRNRMKTKLKTSGIDNEYENNIYKFSQYYGCVAVLELDGVLVAGSIGSLINNDIFLHVLAYDEKFSEYNVGEVCTFNFIQYAIEKHWINFHFLWGRSEFKRRMMAESHDLYSYFIYRNYCLLFLLNKLKVSIKDKIIRCKIPVVVEPMVKRIMNRRKKQLETH